ncbi:uncharacterized protein LOC144167429 [Haemaphysalis longicornis]
MDTSKFKGFQGFQGPVRTLARRRRPRSRLPGSQSSNRTSACGRAANKQHPRSSALPSCKCPLSNTLRLHVLDHSPAEATVALAGLRSERAALLSVQESLESQRSTLTAEKERLESALAACQARLGEQQRELDAGETERRQLQSTLQELKVRH